MIRFLIDEHRRYPWVAPGVALSASAALGTVLPAAIAAIRAVLS